MKHRKILLSEEVKRKHNLCEKEISKAATLAQLDEAYTRKVHNFPTTNDLYQWSSCINYLHNIDRPIIFINSLDDPLVPEVLLYPVRKFAGETRSKFFLLDSSNKNFLLRHFRNASKSNVH